MKKPTKSSNGKTRKRATPIEPKCPECESTSIGQRDLIPATAEINCVHSDGTVEWAGESDVDWDGQRPASNPAEWVCLDCNHTAERSKFLPPGTKLEKA